MNFTTFSVASTNIFPQSNSKVGGQLVTEWNLRSREMVGTASSIEYPVGPSYVHSADDYEVRVLSDDAGVVISTSVLQIMPGRGVVNGHYVESLVPMSIDLLEANTKLKQQARPALKGKLAVGLRAFYSTEATMAGSLLVDNTDNMYLGIQVVILPENELVLPIESPADRSKVTADLRLATFTFSNNSISGITNLNDSKCQYLSADRIANIDMMLSDTYVRKTGLNSKKIYAFAGKGTDPSTGYDTWEDVTDSLIVWDNIPQRTTEKPLMNEAAFVAVADQVALAMPHKQVEGMIDAEGHPEYYATKSIFMPKADYNTNTPGIVDKHYTNHIKEIHELVSHIRQTVNGKQIEYIEQKDEDTVLPPINPAWDIGDYILVGQDFTADIVSDGVRAPSTMYVVLPGLITSILYAGKVENSTTPLDSLTGVELGSVSLNAAEGDARPSTSSDPTTYPIFYSANDNIRGRVNEDYFVATYIDGDNYTKYYYKVATAGDRVFSNAVLVTGEIPFAQENVIGGFLNVSTDATDSGYVYRDDYGRLRLVDYDLLRTGTLAYQLGEDLTFPTGITNEEVQNYLNDYVNQRIAFPNDTQLASATPNTINIYITLTASESQSSITIADIDSRFSTAVCIHILGTANANTTINIIDCQKIKIDNDISGSPIINIYRSNIFYDPYVFNYIRSCVRSDTSFTGFSDIKLWYQKYDDSDPNILVDNMTVSELNAAIVPEDIDFWNPTQPNDNHYLVALNSITFSGQGDIVKCSILVADQSTDNVDPGEKIIVGDFELPQGTGLSYPKTCMTSQLKVTGTFVSAYHSEDSWYVTNTSFTALTATYDEYDMSITQKGSIAFHSITTLVQADIGATSIPGWETDTYSIAYGGVVS